MSEPMSREEHLRGCKGRAMEYVAQGDMQQAFASMGSDMRKHPETENHAGIQLGLRMMMAGLLDTSAEMGKFIEGFN